MDSSFGWAFVGAGAFANKIANTIFTRGGPHHLVSVYNRTFSRAEALANRHHAKAYPTLMEAISAPGVEGVYVATTPNCHLEQVKAILETGKPVLLEKPFALNEKEAAELVSLAKAANVFLSEAMWTWFGSSAQKVAAAVRSGAIGAIQRANISYCFNFMSKQQRLGDPALGGGALLDIGVYAVTYAYRLFGKPTKIICQGELVGGVDSGETITLIYPGFTADLRISMVSSKGWEQASIVGEKGKIYVPFFHQANGYFQKGIVHFGATNYRKEFAAVKEAIRAGKKQSDEVPLSATLDCLAILDECRRQMGLVYPSEK